MNLLKMLLDHIGLPILVAAILYAVYVVHDLRHREAERTSYLTPYDYYIYQLLNKRGKLTIRKEGREYIIERRFKFWPYDSSFAASIMETDKEVADMFYKIVTIRGAKNIAELPLYLTDTDELVREEAVKRYKKLGGKE